MNTPNKAPEISSDRPEVDASRDAYGFVSFAKKVAATVVKTKAPHGLVLAVVGPWGSGKSTLLNFVVNELRECSLSDRPFVIEFNPWWFKTHEDLTGQFLASFQTEVRLRRDVFKDLGNALGKYADALGTTAAIASGLRPVGRIVSWFFGLFKAKTLTVPQAKHAIAERIIKSGKRFVFIIDDIDRLIPTDIAALFRVIKALADFPNVIYILAYDRSVVAKALKVALSVDGDSYMEKVVQSTFSIPAIDGAALRKKLFSDLDVLLTNYEGFPFSQSYWAQLYFDGVDPFVRKPRDVVRLMNSLTVTYPAVAGEVNPIDFIALEVIRVFEPEIYEVLRSNSSYFAGSDESSDRSDRDANKKIYEGWLALGTNQAAIRQLLSHIFPKFGRAMGSGYFYPSGSSHWRRELRVCSEDLYPVYFQFGVPTGEVSRAELDRLIKVAAVDPVAASKVLLAAGREFLSGGASRASELLDRICDFGEQIELKSAEGLLTAICEVGDELLPSSDEDSLGMSSVPNRWRLRWFTSALLKRIPESQLPPLLSNLIANGGAFTLLVDIVDSIDASLSGEEGGDSAFNSISNEVYIDLRDELISRLKGLDAERILKILDLDYVLHRWTRWDGLNSVRAKVIPILLDRERVLRLLAKYLRFSRTQSGNDPTVRRDPKLHPEDLCKIVSCDWLDVTINDAALPASSEAERLAVQAFKSARWRVGRNNPPNSDMENG